MHCCCQILKLTAVSALRNYFALSLTSLTFPFVTLLPSLDISWYPKVLPGRLSLPVVTQKAHLPLKLHLPPSCCDPRFCSLSALNTNLQCPIAFMTDPSHCLALQNCRSKWFFSFLLCYFTYNPLPLPQWCIAGSFSTSHPVPQPPIK